MCRPGAPSPWIERWTALICRDGAVLDVACGSGRHLRLFLSAGHKVVGIDRDMSQLDDLRHRPEVEIVQADLEDGSPWPLPGRKFAGIVVTNYLHRPLLTHLLASLAADGVLIRRIVEAHGGSIDVTSQLEQGTTFTVFLPLHAVAVATRGSGAPAPETRPDA